MRKISWIGVFAILLLLIATPSVFASGQKDSADTYEVVTVVKITGIPWFNRLEEGVKAAKKDLGLNAYQIGPSDADPAQQVKMVEDLISKDVDAICITPNDARALEPVFNKAREHGILILTHESPDQAGKDVDIELIDNVAFARRTWDMLVEGMGTSGKYAIFVGGLTVPLHNLWADEGIKYAKAKYPGLKLVTERIPCGEDQELSKQKTLELLKTYPDLDGIVGFGSLGPPGAAQALKEKGLAGKVTVVGNVIPGHGAPYLKEGSMTKGILWDPKDAGYALNWVAKYMLDGGKISELKEIPGIGKVVIDGDVIKVDAIVDITKENVDSFGF
ncbi:autoinducer 2 ABC transporter substrate-binding protein [Treponema parvum]|uniref:Autoinducer 2 ABC transporter substrate-binding protein n=1 Tax=Treponema parvum TaxID=138851 RepID=A0A975F4F9_9SPIR|nr:autoinducer 2 ABC transporter substrate-binding protein [Treponema parvum]QTQ14245.1 autoinducer 2 ABC transporter substrate-binding protein [Treponema parvum]